MSQPLESNSWEAYVSRLNDYHTELGMLHDALEHIFLTLYKCGDVGDVPVWMTSTAFLLDKKFSEMVEKFPFPNTVR
jgi:hypothetical protein